ncbi:short-chain dehydrogenase TIC 32, chloroplastic-like isoform X2 [Telopea speciosissima]|uniref:short-chain dehydrogenase TIC 32, chloroplastic-like isoform X2 n=1 Tax=Telopea speciosissima TaxID=54955 RepID=UPI001CC6A17B|nr:short-chain dehydrogenase TIC 32, chloroplastic-like isoform X2 [Telopea speciosissima]
MGLWDWFSRASASGFGSSSTAEQVTDGIDATALTAIVTGATSGIGKETARVLAVRGAKVIIPSRNLESGLKVKEVLLKEQPNAKLEVMEMDLASIKSVTSFARSFNSSHRHLNILVNNAAIMGCPFQLSVDGVELQFATNHLGHFLLTKLLLDKLKATSKSTGIEGRIVNVSSSAHRYPNSSSNLIGLDKINDISMYKPFDAYGRSKLANILHANELSKQLQGASTTCYVALHPNLKGISGKYFADCNEKQPSSQARDKDLGRKLWDFSQDLLNNLNKPK